MDLVNQILELFKTAVKLGGGLWAIWGAITFASGLKDHNGPDIKSGIWQIIGGGVILGAVKLFGSI